jgi:hypothetical protein
MKVKEKKAMVHLLYPEKDMEGEDIDKLYEKFVLKVKEDYNARKLARQIKNGVYLNDIGFIKPYSKSIAIEVTNRFGKNERRVFEFYSKFPFMKEWADKVLVNKSYSPSITEKLLGGIQLFIENQVTSILNEYHKNEIDSKEILGDFTTMRVRKNSVERLKKLDLFEGKSIPTWRMLDRLIDEYGRIRNYSKIYQKIIEDKNRGEEFE